MVEGYTQPKWNEFPTLHPPPPHSFFFLYSFSGTQHWTNSKVKGTGPVDVIHKDQPAWAESKVEKGRV